MKLKRSGAALSVLAASTLLLSACGSDNQHRRDGFDRSYWRGLDLECRVRRQVGTQGQWFHRPGQRHDAFRECVRAGVQRTDPQLHLQRLRRRCE